MTKTYMVVSIFIGVVVLGLLARLFMVPNLPRHRESFMQKEIGAPAMGTSMGPYDSVSIQGASGWLMNEDPPQCPVGK